MGEQRDALRSALRTEIMGQRRAFKDRIAARDPSPEALMLAVRKRREAFAALMRRVGTEPTTTADLDRMVRLGDRFYALIDRTRGR